MNGNTTENQNTYNSNHKSKKKKFFSIDFLKNLPKNIRASRVIKQQAKELEKDIVTPNSNDAISVQHLSKIFTNIVGTPFKVLDDVNFVVKKGEFHGFIGNNGAGKTTTIRLILNYYQDGFGKIFINGIDSKNKRSKDKIGYIPEISVFPKNITIFEYLYFFATLSNIDKKKAEIKVEQLMTKYGFSKDFFNKSADKLSSGQKKKILLMQALINDPEILILDEPTANLDPTARNEFFEVIKQLHKEGKTILISSHILTELEKYIDSFTILENGKVKVSGKIADKLKGKDFNYKIQTTNNSQFFEILSKEKYKLHLLKASILIEIKDAKAKTKLFTLAENNKIEIISFVENKLSLDEIYLENVKTKDTENYE
ncbi:ABC transporter ATP-binding protein [Metamycoplasma hyosynoviae]|uniref:ABC transporter ATP-binding protein n=1 Tax=Metamycoplasma hyosynoviae TaxID=29559 RepID=UPI0023659B1F|nr:ABC transporter ATP-binding protein [Metamycoplasma hyosynoviae]MDD7893385.1 ABC transporter ATP-binding protein [Metamycoplasma hyosynoviae]MDD7907179.1 ABC transporter ATP-binding protein [Metamycoplasma hyosynoviae]